MDTGKDTWKTADAGRRKRRAKEKVTTKKSMVVVLRRTHVHPLLLVAVLLLPGPQPTTADVSMSFGGGGCAVGYRSGFTDEASFPCFAACSAPPGRSPPFSGDVGGPVARGLCAPGWHVCTVGSARNARFEARCVAPAVRLLLGMWGHAAVAVGRGACAFLIVLHNLHGVDVAVGGGSMPSPCTAPSPPPRVCIPRPCFPRVQPIATVG